MDFKRVFSDNLFAGKTKEGRGVYLNPRTRSTHMHVIGASGEGKSKFLEHMIREDIINGNGLCLIDPHGYLYNDIVKWCATKDMAERKKIILFNPSADGWSFGFNPLRKDTAEISFLVDSMVKAVAKVWGGEDTDRTPLLKRCLRTIFHVLQRRTFRFLKASTLSTQLMTA